MHGSTVKADTTRLPVDRVKPWPVRIYCHLKVLSISIPISHSYFPFSFPQLSTAPVTGLLLLLM